MIHIIHKLRMARGTNAKLAILKQEQDNEDWKLFLLATHDSSINYFISSPADTTFKDEVDVGDMLTHLGNLSSRAVTGNAARQHAIEGSQLYGELFRLVLGGSLKSGVSITTINKAYPGLIPVWKVMLAKDVPITKFPVIASTKYDGVRLTAFVDFDQIIKVDGKQVGPKVRLILRSGKAINIKSLEYEMGKQPEGVYDGELVAGDGLQESRTKITGSVNRCLKGSDTDIQDYTFCIFDMLEHAEWEEEATSRPYVKRIIELNKMSQNTKVRLADMYQLNELSEINNLYANLIKQGYEGLIVRYAHDPYEWKRSDKLIKMKATNECVLHCTGISGGKGKYEGMIGALICQGIVDGKDIRVMLGSGLTDHDREQSPEHFAGKDIDVLYNDIVQAKDALYYSLFLPRFKRVRGDHNV